MQRKLQASLLALLMMSLIGCSTPPVGYCPQPVEACQEFKDWLKAQNKINPMPYCGGVYLNKLADLKDSLKENCQ
jgi:hypothetical protein